ncbi:hypothetical protein AALF15_01210 [Corynebacteriaceae bacterium 7-707]
MTITPDQAKTLLDGQSEKGLRWKADWNFTDRTAAIVREDNPSEEVMEVHFKGDDTAFSDGDLALAAAAPDLAQTVIDQAALIETLYAGLRERDQVIEDYRAERDEFQNEMISSERKQATLEAEVERRTRERLDRNPETKARVEDALAHPERAEAVTVKTPTLPDPADVPKGEVWEAFIWYDDDVCRRGTAIKSAGGDWVVVRDDGSRNTFRTNEYVELISRLVPDTRRVIDTAEDLAALPEWSVVIDQDGEAWQKSPSGYWVCGTLVKTAAELIDRRGPVTILHAPEVTA